MNDRRNPKHNPVITHWHPEMLKKVGGAPYGGSGSGSTIEEAIDAAATAAGTSVADVAGNTAETDVEGALAEIYGLIAALSSSGFIQTTGGGGEEVESHGAMGATETIDLADGNIHIGTLDANCTFTFTGYAALSGLSWVVILDQDGTGGWTTTWPAAVDDAAGLSSALDTTASGRQIVSFFSPDGGTTIYWAILGPGSGGGVTDHGALTGLTPDDDHPQYLTETRHDALDHTGLPGVGTGGTGPLLISDDPSTPLVFADLIQNEAQDDLVYADV